MMKTLMAVSATIITAGCAAASLSASGGPKIAPASEERAFAALASPRATPKMSCDLIVKRNRDGADLEARIKAPMAQKGFYDVRIIKSDSAGTAEMTQGGAFDMGAGETLVTGAADVSMSMGATLKAVMTLTGMNGETLCIAKL